MALRAQGATEYLVLLAVVLIIALVSVALLGFFPGMASDAQMTQSQTYWQSATPISVVEISVKAASTWADTSWPYLRIRNSGQYPIRLTKMIGSNGTSYVSIIYCSGCPGSIGNISDFFYLAPGEELYFANSINGGGLNSRTVLFTPQNSASSSYQLAAYSSGCRNSSADPGMLILPTLGFEYIEYIEGQQITKRQIGTKPLIAKCLPPA
jgi:archaellin